MKEKVLMIGSEYLQQYEAALQVQSTGPPYLYLQQAAKKNEVPN